LKNVSITNKIMLILGIFGIFTLGVAFYATGQIASIGGSYNSLMTGNAAAGVAIARASRQFQTARAAIGDLMLANTDAENTQAETEMKTSLAAMSQKFDEAAADSSENASDILALKAQALSAVNIGCQKAIAAGAASTLPAAQLASQQIYLSECSPLFPPISNALSVKVSALDAQSKTAVAALRGATHGTIIKTYGGIVGGLIIIGVLGFFGARTWIIKPIRSQIDTMGRLAKGDYDAEVAGTERRDEVGAIARAVSIFRDAGQQKVRLEEESTRQRAHAEEQRTQQEGQRALAAQQSSLVVESLA
jgi:methyl-accepting chemotaxis protein